jgi:hypothetical protein
MKLYWSEIVTEHNLCAFTCIIFLTNAIMAAFYDHYFYSLSFLFLTITSIIFRLYNNIYTLLLDKIPMAFIISYGAYLLYEKFDITSVRNILFIGSITSTFLLTIYLYFYGYCTDTYCYNIDKKIGVFYHAILHIISSFGHHLLLLL